MKSKYIILVTLTLACIVTLIYKTVNVDTTDQINETVFEGEKSPIDLLFMQRAFPSGEIKSGAYKEAALWRRQMEASRSAESSTAIWEFSGPLNIGGRITDIEIPNGDADTYYVGAASGGIFKTTNGGGTWQPVFDDQAMLAIGDIEISKTNNDLVFVGTGEVNAGGGSLAYDGDGVYRSEDGGISWESKGLEAVGSIGKVIIDPSDDDVIFVGAMGPLFRNDTNRGVYRSTDGGDNWEQVLFIAENTGIIDMVIHPTNSNIVYAVAWQRERSVDNRTYGGDNSGIYRSDDGGDSWNELTTGLPSAGSQKGRISIDIAQSNPNVLYASYADANGSIQGNYRSADGGDSWATINSSQLTNVGFHWWFRGLFVDPTDENTIFHVGFDVERSVDGGMSWQPVFSNVHVDQHALAFNSMNTNEVLLGNDGGLYVSPNNGATAQQDLNLPITQFYRFYVDPQNENKIYGGSQDNSTMRTTTGGLSDWSIINGGDGFQPLVRDDDTNVIYALSQRGGLVRSTNDAASFNAILNGINPADRNNWDTPIALDPVDNDIVYFGTQRVYRSTNTGTNWTAISPDLTDGGGMGNLTFGTLTTIDISPLNSDIIYTGSDDGNVYRSLDNGVTWDNISTTLPERWVTRVQADPLNENVVYATFSGYRFGEDTGHVFRSEDQGTTWEDVTNNLPDIPVNDIEIDTFGNLFLGTDIGVLASANNGDSWEPFGENLPSVVVNDLHLDLNSGFLFAGTYGRSSYKVDLSDNILTLNDFALSETTLALFPNPASDHITINYNGSGEEVITMFDQLGRKIRTLPIQSSTTQMDIQDLPTGVYIVKVGSQSQKLVKR